MSQLTVRRAAPSRALSMLALLGLGCWAVLTLVMGVGDAVNGVRDVRLFTAPPGSLDAGDLSSGHGMFVFSVTVGLLWLLSLNVVLVAVVMGVVELAVTHRTWRRAVAFAVAAVAGPVLALVVSQVANGDDEVVPTTSYLEAVAPGIALVAIALVTLAAAWWLLGVPLRARRATSRPAS
jgi:hypothetical protein